MIAPKAESRQNLAYKDENRINLPFAGLGLVMTPLVVKLRHEDRLSFRASLASVDYIGIITFTGGLTTFLVGLSWGGLEFAWNSYHTLVPLLLGLVVLGFSLVWEARFAKRPFIKLYIYTSYSTIATLLAAFLQGYLVSDAL